MFLSTSRVCVPRTVRGSGGGAAGEESPATIGTERGVGEGLGPSSKKETQKEVTAGGVGNEQKGKAMSWVGRVSSGGAVSGVLSAVVALKVRPARQEGTSLSSRIDLRIHRRHCSLPGTALAPDLQSGGFPHFTEKDTEAQSGAVTSSSPCGTAKPPGGSLRTSKRRLGLGLACSPPFFQP